MSDLNTGLDKAIHAFGGQRKLARALGISAPTLNKVVKKYSGKIPPKYLQKIHELTGVTPHELRPDIHPNPTSGLPVEKNNNPSVV
ncbi:transcriptional regulator [Cedecea davisae]|uniref:transcriptional regulator n=1 Tax=Cedecea davisae TaxID=158484 RepID=UPI001D0A7778|nr:YdaS family helix-turn-helix protein [Cedecea davisae]